jgi:hypothetical protein
MVWVRECVNVTRASNPVSGSGAMRKVSGAVRSAAADEHLSLKLGAL